MVLRRLKLSTRLLMTYILIGLVPLVIMGVFSVFYARQILSSQIQEGLISVCDAKSISIKNFLTSHVRNAVTLSSSGMLLDAVETLEEAFDTIGGSHIDNPLWQALYNRYHPGLEFYIKEHGYLDLYLIAPDGDIVFSIQKKSDLGKNIHDADFKDSSLEHCFNRAISREFLSDFSLYPPHGNIPVAFAGAPVYRDNLISGVVALAIPIDMINHIMLKRSDLGESGETYLVGEDYLLRSDTHHSANYTVKNSFENPDARQIRNVAVTKAFMGVTGAVSGTNYLGNDVITAFTPVLIHEMTWAVIADLDRREAFEPVRLFKVVVLTVIFWGVLVVLFVSYFISARISGPVKRLTAATEKIRQGHFDIDIDDALTRSSDEVGLLARSFNRMILEIKQIMKDLVSEIREKEAVHEALRDKEERLQSILNNTTSVVFLKDLKGCIILANPRFEALLGRPLDEISGRSVYEIFSGTIADQLSRHDRQVIENDSPVEYEETLSLSGGVFTFLVVKFPVHDKQGAPYAVCAIATDITDLKKKEQSLEDALLFNEKIISESPIGMAIYDAAGNCVEINKAMCKSIGATKAQGITQNYHDINSWKSSGLYDLILDAIRENATRARELNLNTSFGKEIWLSVFIMPFSSGGQTHLLLMGIDISERIKAQEEKEKMAGQLRQAHKMEAIGTLAGGIAHDFNNILSAIMGYSQMIQSELPPDSRAMKRIDKVIGAGERARELVRQILSFSRKSDQDRVPILFQFILEETIKLLRATLPSTISISQEIDPDCGYIMANATQIHQVVMNLCTNAAQAMEENGGCLTVSLSSARIPGPEDDAGLPALKPGEYAVLTVRDTGVGIPAAIIDKIFDPYFTTKGIGKGSGMGLAVVHGIVKAHDGTLTVDSIPGKGSKFTLYFPRAREKDETPADISLPELRRGVEHILVVDDEESLVEIIRLRLEDLGYTVTAMTDSTVALEKFKEFPDRFDLVVTDQTMPKMTGKQLVKKMFSLRPDLPVILCSGYSRQIDETKAAELGIRAFMMKPVDMDDLARMIQTLLDEPGAAL